MKILLGDLNAKVEKEDIFKLVLLVRFYMKPVTITGSE
jgi:hypothetical protein